MPVNARRIGTAPAQSARDHAPGRPLGGAPAARQRVGVGAEGIDEMQLGVRPERLAQRQRRGALVDADLDHAPRALRRLQQHARVLLGVHRPRRDQTRADRQRAQAHIVAQAFRRQTTQACGEAHRHETDQREVRAAPARGSILTAGERHDFVGAHLGGASRASEPRSPYPRSCERAPSERPRSSSSKSTSLPGLIPSCFRTSCGIVTWPLLVTRIARSYHRTKQCILSTSSHTDRAGQALWHLRLRRPAPPRRP